MSKYKINELDKFLEDIKDDTVHNKNLNSVYKSWYFDVRCHDCPETVVDEVWGLWQDKQLGNDTSVCYVTVDEDLFNEYPNIYFWLIHKGVPVNDDVTISLRW